MPESNRTGRVLGIVLLLAALGAVGFWLSGAFAPWSFTKQVVVEPQGYFFRVKASYTHGDEKIDFDYVAVCGYRTTVYKDNSSSNDGTYDPKLMVRAMADGGALMIRTPRACKGETTANGQAPADLLPFIVWFDDVEDLTFGWGYASPDAYDSPHAQVAFHGATIEAATAEEWQAWRAKAEAEYEQKGMLPGPWGWSHPIRRSQSEDPPGTRMARVCQGYIRLKIPEEVRPQVRDYWPADRPRYWAPPPDQRLRISSWISDDGEVHDAIYEAGGNRADIQTFTSRAVYGEEIGVPTRAGGGTLETYREHYPADTFPLLPRSRSVETPPLEATDSYPRRLLVREDMKGFVACGGDMPVDRLTPDFDAAYRDKTHPLYVNDVLAIEDTNPLLPPVRFFERDEFYFVKAPWR